MGWQSYRIIPFDTVFFRDGRPFVEGEGANVESVFPPTPFTAQGLIRSKLLTRCLRNPDHLESKDHLTCAEAKVVGVFGSHAGELQVRGPWLMIDDQPLLPCPFDLIAEEGAVKAAGEAAGQNKQGRVETSILIPASEEKVQCSPQGRLISLAPPKTFKGKFEAVPGWIGWDAFVEYLRGDGPVLVVGKNWFRDSDLWSDERRSGLEIDDQSRHAVEGHLYFARHVRLKPNVSLVVDLDEVGGLEDRLLDFPCTPFGGERRPVAIQKISPDLIKWRNIDGIVKQRVETTGNLKLVFGQIGWFNQGFIPENWNVDGDTQWPGVYWVAARVERPESIGGWDLVRCDQKPIRHFVPKGSVYYLRNSGPLPGELTAGNYCLSQTPNGEIFQYNSFGIGHVFIGTWKE